MSWTGFALFCALSTVGFLSAWRAASAARRKAAVSACLLVALVASVGLRYAPAAEASLFPPALYAYVKPWWTVVLGLAFLGSAAPQLPERRSRAGVSVLAAFFFIVVAQRAWASASVHPEEFRGAPTLERPVCRQTTGFSCGAAASSTLLAQLGLFVSEREMARRCLTTRFMGTDEIGVLKGLGEKLAASGRTAEIVRLGAAGIGTGDLPAMAPVEYSTLMEHWVVVLGCTPETVTIADPLHGETSREMGIREIPRVRFERMYKGLLIRVAGPPPGRLLGPPGDKEQ